MTIKVENRETNDSVIYKNVDKVTDCFDENRNFCHRLHMGEETATFPACEWKIYELKFVPMF